MKALKQVQQNGEMAEEVGRGVSRVFPMLTTSCFQLFFTLEFFSVTRQENPKGDMDGQATSTPSFFHTDFQESLLHSSDLSFLALCW